MAANDADVKFCNTSEVELWQWVEANPVHINDVDSHGWTPLCTAIRSLKSVSLVLWLVNEKAADANIANEKGFRPLFYARSLAIVSCLLNCGADPTLPVSYSRNFLMESLHLSQYNIVARLLQDPRIRASINEHNRMGNTALHYACEKMREPDVPAIIQRLIQVGADLTIKNAQGKTPLNLLQESHPTHPTTLALVEQSLDAEKASFLVKARRLVMAAGRSDIAATPSFLRGRVASGLPLPTVALIPATEDQGNEDDVGRR